MFKVSLSLVAGVLISGCASPNSGQVSREPVSERTPNLVELRGKLGLEGDTLGFTEKAFDSCSAGLKGADGKCGARFLGMVNFRILCRETEETVEEVATNLKPLVSQHMQWKMNGMSGITRTSSDGVGQVLILSPSSLKGQRLVLMSGKQYLGLEIDEVGQIVVPIYWCDPTEVPSEIVK